MSRKKKAPARKAEKPRGEELLARIDKNPDDRQAWNELAGEPPIKPAKRKKASRRKPK